MLGGLILVCGVVCMDAAFWSLDTEDIVERSWIEWRMSGEFRTSPRFLLHARMRVMRVGNRWVLLSHT